MAKNSEVSSWTAQVRPKYVIYTPKQGNEYPQTFHIGVAQGLCWARAWLFSFRVFFFVGCIPDHKMQKKVGNVM